MILQQVIYKKHAIYAAILCVLIAALATIWPMRLYKENHTYASGLDPVSTSETISEEQDAGEYFVAQHTHLQTLKFYVESVKAGSAATFQLFRVGENGAMELTAEETVTLPEEVPAYAIVSVDADVTVGDTYVYTIRGLEGSLFTVGCESQEQALATGKAPYYQLGFYNDSTVDDMAVKSRMEYRVPENKWSCLIRGIVYVLVAAAAMLLTKGVFVLLDRRLGFAHASTSVTTVQGALRAFLTPVIAVGFGLAFLAVWPLKLFDGRILDILIYEAGVILGAAWCLLGLWHDNALGPKENTMGHRPGLRHVGIILCIALLLDRSAVYMNATNDYIHDAATNWIIVLLAIILLLMGEMSSVLNGATMLAALVSVVTALVYYVGHAVPASETEAAWKNSVTISMSAAIVLGSIAVVSVLWMLVDAVTAKKRPQNHLSKGFALILTVLAGWMVVFSNTRVWIPLLVAVWLLFYLRYRFWEGRGYLLEDLCKGIVLDCACKILYSMLHRYYLAYLYSRFSMHFHTPTVTAYYLLIAGAAALTLFLRKARRIRGLGIRKGAGYIWKEAFALGMICSYMVMSLTRSGIGVLAVMAGFAAFYLGNLQPQGNGREDTAVCPENIQRKRKKRAAGFTPGMRIRTGLATLAAMAVIVCMTFPVAFTGQRMISTVYGQPHRFESLEPYDDWVLRNVDWNCTAFMNIEIFIRDFGDRILGGEIGSRLYYGNEWYIPQGYRTASADELQEAAEPRELGTYAMAGELPAGSFALVQTGNAQAGEPEDAMEERLVASLEDAAESALKESGDSSEGSLQAELEAGSIDNGDVSNGRLGLYLAYIKQLNWTGHDEMGVQLMSGEIAMHAHNIYLQTAYDCGIPGGVLLFVATLALLFGSFMYAKREGRRDSCALFPFLLTGGFILIGMVEWIFQFSNPYTIVLMMAMAPILVRENRAQ